MSFVVPGHPIGKARPRLGKGGVVYTPVATRDYERSVRISAQSALMAKGKDAWDLGSKYSVAMTVYFGRRPGKPPDLDNVLKSILDGCSKGILFGDDSQVWRLFVDRARDIGNPRVEVVVMDMEV